MKDETLIDSFTDNPRMMDYDYQNHYAAIRRMVNRNLIKKHGLLFEENEHKWKEFDFALENMED